MTTDDLIARLRLESQMLPTHEGWLYRAAARRLSELQKADALERQSAAPAQGTVRVRAYAVADAGGRYIVYGYHDRSEQETRNFCLGVHGIDHDACGWITADIPMPVAQEIAGRVEGA